MASKEYGIGRLKVIDEMIKWTENEIKSIKDFGTDNTSHINASLSGQIKAYSKILQKLKVKKQNLKP